MKRVIRLTELDLKRIVNRVIREDLTEYKDPFSITVVPTEEFKSKINEIKNSEGKSSFLALSSEFTLKNNGDRFNLVKVATTPFDLSENNYNGKLYLGKQDDYWLSYIPENEEIYVHESRMIGTSAALNGFSQDSELTNTDRRFATKDYNEEGLTWIGGYYCKFENGFEVGQQDHRGYFEITKVVNFS